MPRNLSENDRETVKRTVPKASNKILAAAIARLYIAFPNRQLWAYTGLQGAAVLTNDLVGNTFWIKLVDISVCLVMLAESSVLLTISRRQSAVFYGIKKFTILSTITKTGPFSIHLNSKVAWQDSLLWTRRRLSNSRRRWTSGRTVQASKLNQHPSRAWAQVCSLPEGPRHRGNRTVCLEE